MVVVINGNGPWPSNEGDAPGLYARFTNAAIETIKSGSRGKVATIKPAGAGNAVAGKVYRMTRVREAEELFGDENVEDIRFAFMGGASEVVVSVYDVEEDIPQYAEALNTLETYEFHQFVTPLDAAANFNTEFLTWHAEMKNVTKNYIAFYADKSAEGNITATKAAITGLGKEENIVYVANGVYKADGVEVKSDLYAFYIAGIVAGAGLAESITSRTLPFVEPNIRFGSIEQRELLAAGALVTKIDGEDVIVLQGLTIGEKPNNKIRIVRAKQAILDDIDRTAKRAYIGKITNHEDGRIAIVNGVKQYLSTMATAGVIHPIFAVYIDPDNPPTTDELFIVVNIKILDSIEYIKLTAVVRQTDEM